MKTVVNLATGEVINRDLTPEEIAAIPDPPAPDYAAQIRTLEQENMLPKATRKFML